MRAIRSWFGKKYLMHILLSLTLLTVLVLVISSFSVYLHSKSTILRIQEEANLKTLQQIDYNVQYMNQIVMQSATSSFFDPDSVFLMNMKTLQYTEIAPRLDRLNNWISSAPFLESIIVYNAYLDMYISTRYTGDFRNDSMDGALAGYLHGLGDETPRPGLTVLRRESPGDMRGQVFTYLMSGPVKSANKGSVMAFNIRSEWLLENLQNIRLLDHGATRNLAIVDRDGIVLQSNGENPANMVQLADALGSLQKGKLTYIQESPGGGKQIVTVLRSNNGDWHLASFQDYETVYRSTSRLWGWYMTLLAVFILMAMVISMLVARFLYRPVASMMADLSVQTPDGAGGMRDEFGAIRNRYKNTLDHLEQLRQAYDKRTNSMQSYYLRKWLMDSGSVTSEEIGLIFPERERNGICGSLDAALYRICIFRIDRFRSFEAVFSVHDQKLIKFAVCNIAGEVLGKRYPCSVVYMQGDQFAAVMLAGCAGGTGPEADRALEDQATADILALLPEIQESVSAYYHVSLTAAMADASTSARQLTAAYSQTQETAQYRFKYGLKSLLTREMTLSKELNEADRDFLAAWDKRMEEALKTGREDSIGGMVRELERLLAELPCSGINQALMTVISGIARAVQDMNRNGILQVPMDNKEWFGVLESETLSEAVRALEEALSGIIRSRRQEKTPHAHALLTEAVKELVDEHLSDPSLGPALAADLLRVQASQLKKVFRETSGLPLHEYIHQTRLNKARLLLETTAFTVNDITEKVGYGNQSYFFQMFKKQFGATPKEYRQKMLLDRK